MVVPLAATPPPITPARVLELARRSPTERWETVDHELVPELLALYEWFLELTGHKAGATERLRDTGSGAEARQQDKRFGDLVFEALRGTAHPELLRYVVV